MQLSLRSKESRTSTSQIDITVKLHTDILLVIADFCDPAIDSLSWRLTCRALADVAHNQFIDRFIARRRCCILDHKRLSNLHHITNKAHSITKVKSVTLLLQEHTEDHHKHWTGGKSSAECSCGSKWVNEQNWALVKDIVRELGKEAKAAILVDFARDIFTGVRIRPGPQASTLLRNMLELVRSACCPLEGLHMSNRFEVECKDVYPLGAQDPGLHQLQAFAYLLRPENAQDFESRRIMQQRDVVKTVIRHARRLNHLELNVDSWTNRMNEPLIKWSRKLLTERPESAELGRKSWFLQSVSLANLQARLGTLVDLFTDCQGTLQSVELIGLTLYDGGDVWRDLLHKHTECHSLQLISITGVELGHNHRKRFVKFIVPEKGLHHRRWEMLSGCKDPEWFLRVNIEMGLGYSKTRHPEPLSAPSSIIP